MTVRHSVKTALGCDQLCIEWYGDEPRLNMTSFATFMVRLILDRTPAVIDDLEIGGLEAFLQVAPNESRGWVLEKMSRKRVTEAVLAKPNLFWQNGFFTNLSIFEIKCIDRKGNLIADTKKMEQIFAHVFTAAIESSLNQICVRKG